MFLCINITLEAKNNIETYPKQGENYKCIPKEYSFDNTIYEKLSEAKSKEMSFYIGIDDKGNIITSEKGIMSLKTWTVTRDNSIKNIEYYKHIEEKTINGKSQQVKFSMKFTKNKTKFKDDLGFKALYTAETSGKIYTMTYNCIEIKGVGSINKFK